jgi:hypothetical protein
MKRIDLSGHPFLGVDCLPPYLVYLEIERRPRIEPLSNNSI